MLSLMKDHRRFHSYLMWCFLVFGWPLLAYGEQDGDQKRLSMNMATALGWLPPNTETLLVAEGPFKLESAEEKERTLEELWRQRVTGLLSGMARGKHYKSLVGRRVVTALEASRAFQPPTGLGVFRFHGCEILIFEEEIGKKEDGFMDAVLKDSAEVLQIAGHQVARFDERRDWRIFVTQPTKSTLLIASDRKFVTEVLQRMANGGKGRALPSDLPEWQQLKGNTSCWAIRHYDRKMGDSDYTSPLCPDSDFLDADAIGIVFFIGSHANAAHVRYLSNDEHVGDRLATRLTLPIGERDTIVTPKIRKLSASGFEVTHSLKNWHEVAYFSIYFMSMLGHGVAL